MKLFVPAVGYRIRLTDYWTFDLYDESRNSSLVEVLLNDPERVHKGRREKHRVTMPAGTILEVDRVYVRTMSKAAQSVDDDYDSLTFKIIEHPTLGSKRKHRFWAKLSDVNEIEYELPENFTEGKDRARENVMKPKKLTADNVRELIRQAFSYRTPSNWNYNLPEWVDDAARKQLHVVINEFNRIRLAHYRTMNFHMTEKYISPRQIFNEIMSGKPIFQRDEKTDECSREFKWQTRSHNNSYICDMSNFWVRVYSGKDDLEIKRIEVGC